MGKKKPVELTRDEQIALNISQTLLHHVHDFKYLPPPNNAFEIGEKVAIGSLIDPIIVGKSDCNRVYAIEANNTIVSFVWDKLFHLNDNPQLMRPRDVLDRSSMTSRCIDDLFNMRFHSGVLDDPVYQRDLVWAPHQKELLISSIFDRADIGKLTVIRLPYEADMPSYEIIDGKQRLTTITDFMVNRFKISNLYWKDLCSRDRREFGDHIVAVSIIEGKLTELDKVNFFLRLNQTGVPQTAEHMQLVTDYRDQLMQKVNK